ncbi:quinone oxidoreductase family protein [Polluticaenibacter yanchengensis]|uniref:Zinc-binding alcohol dehydrogenase family protein n=1 Tax=Polluticaenibacter yanchengensis TaxID=3014562 RepID=A0ABT4UL66_9BACT|nr:zinc-binding alcohol dehydrogenase family protein [Chitinophagaceae bacterium LY-5]
MDQSMKAAFLIGKGEASRAFEIRETPVPSNYPPDYILIKVEAFGLNYADVTARIGNYRDAPPMPAVLGYDVAGEVIAVGKEVTMHAVGDRVVALTRFGGYAEYAVTNQMAAVKISKEDDVVQMLALATQGATAWYCVEESTTIYQGDKVLVTAAAGGVGSIITQLAKNRGAEVYGITGSAERGEVAKSLGAKYVINRNTEDVFEAFDRLSNGHKIDAMFDSAGGKFVKKGLKHLAPCGKFVSYGGSSAGDARNIFQMIPFALSFGFYSPIPFLMKSQSYIGVNMLRVADFKPQLIHLCISSIYEQYKRGNIKILPGKMFAISELAEAHTALEKSKVAGKIAVKW